MPVGYKKFENPMDDRRRKLHPDQYDEIRLKFKDGASKHGLSREYGISRKMISIIVNPDVAEKVGQRIREHWKDYSNREDLTKATRELRRRKVQMGLSFPVSGKKTDSEVP